MVLSPLVIVPIITSGIVANNDTYMWDVRALLFSCGSANNYIVSLHFPFLLPS